MELGNNTLSQSGRERQISFMWNLQNNTASPCGSAGKESPCNAGDLGSIPELGRSPGKGKGYPLQYSGLENPLECIVHGVAKSWTQLSDFHFTSLPGLERERLSNTRK